MGQESCPYCKDTGINHIEGSANKYVSWSMQQVNVLKELRTYSNKPEAPLFLKNAFKTLTKLNKEYFELNMKRKQMRETYDNPYPDKTVNEIIKMYRTDYRKLNMKRHYVCRQMRRIKHGILRIPIIPIIIPRHIDI